MDVETGPGADGIRVTEQLKKRFPEVKIIVITDLPEYNYVMRARKAGAESFWYKKADREEFLQLLDRTMAGESVYPAEQMHTALGRCNSDDLTPRERDILRGLVRGESNKEIAAAFQISPITVKQYVSDLLVKTGFKTRTELAVNARASGLVVPKKDPTKTE